MLMSMIINNSWKKLSIEKHDSFNGNQFSLESLKT